jgi:hypothetical protein
MAVTLGLILVASLKQAWSMTFIAVRYPHGQRNQSVQRGNTARGTPRSLCQNPLWGRGRCLLDSGTRGGVPAGTHTLLAMRLQASGVRETARSLPLGPHPVRRARTQHAGGREAVHPPGVRPRHPAEGAWDLERAGEGEAEREERGSLVEKKGHPRWLGPALAPHTGTGWAYGCGRRQAHGFWRLTALLAPCGLPRSSSAYGGASPRHRDPDEPGPGTRHPPQSARPPLT